MMRSTSLAGLCSVWGVGAVRAGCGSARWAYSPFVAPDVFLGLSGAGLCAKRLAANYVRRY